MWPFKRKLDPKTPVINPKTPVIDEYGDKSTLEFELLWGQIVKEMKLRALIDAVDRHARKDEMSGSLPPDECRQVRKNYRQVKSSVTKQIEDLGKAIGNILFQARQQEPYMDPDVNPEYLIEIMVPASDLRLLEDAVKK
jgi:hypothetical protein